MSELNEDVRKAIADLTGIEVAEDANLDTIKSSFGERYVAKELHKKELDAIAGKIKGTTESKLKKVLGEQAKGKSYDEMIELLPQHFESLQEQIKEAQKAGGDEKAAKLQAELDKFRELADQNAATIETLQTERDAAKTEAEQRIEQFKTEAAVKQAWSGAKWSDTADQYKRQGIWATEVEGKFQFKIEGGKTLVYDADGNIYTGGTANQLTADQLFEQVLKKTGSLKQNPGGTPPGGRRGEPDPNMPEAKRKALERAQKRIEAARK